MIDSRTATPASLPLTRYVEHVMGMPISLALRGRHTDDERAVSAWEQVMSELQEIDEVFSTYRPESFVSRLRRREVELHECPPQVAEVLALGDVAREQSAGAFDMYLPGPDGTRLLDPSGVVKGWAVERASASLGSLPDTDYCLSAGGDMTCRTTDPGQGPWRIGVEDPADPSHVLAVIPVYNGGVATSGAAHRGQHIRDPRTGLPPVGLASVTVVAPSLTWADIDATAAYVLGRDAAGWLRGRPGRVALIVHEDGSTTTTGRAA